MSVQSRAVSATAQQRFVEMIQDFVAEEAQERGARGAEKRVALFLGITPQYLAGLKSGARRLGGGLLRRIALQMGVSMHYFQQQERCSFRDFGIDVVGEELGEWVRAFDLADTVDRDAATPDDAHALALAILELGIVEQANAVLREKSGDGRIAAARVLSAKLTNTVLFLDYAAQARRRGELT